MAVLVTGGAGFIGSHLVERLLNAGLDVVCVDDLNDFYDPQIKRHNIELALHHPRFHLETISITDREGMETVFARYPITQVAHLAGRAGVRPSLQEPELYGEVNIQGTLHLLELCRQHGVERLIFGSSSSVYGATSHSPFREEEAADYPISPYAASKRAGELLCYTYHHLYRLPVVCLRFFTVFGPRQRPDLAIHKFTRALYEGREIALFGDGTSSRDYTFVDDVVDAIVRTLTHEPALGYEIFNLGASTPVRLLDMVKLLEHETGRKAAIRFESEQMGDVPFTYADTTKALHVLGWRATTPFEVGVHRFVEWYKRSRLELEGLEGNWLGTAHAG